jgi:hypothetical protein
MHYLVRLPWRAARDPRRAVGDIVFLKGLCAGAYGWRKRVAQGEEEEALRIDGQRGEGADRR